jgi:hypothetical protein
MRSGDLAAMKMLIVIFWVVTPCGLVGGYQLFGGTYPEDGDDTFLRNVGNHIQELRFQVLTAAKMSMLVFWGCNAVWTCR